MKTLHNAQRLRGRAINANHLAGGTLASSSSSVSLGMVMMLTAGLGVSKMIIGCEGSPLVCGAEDVGLQSTTTQSHSVQYVFEY